ncbi:hypothetical protein ACXIZN_41460 [Amycolatopsis sp. TRM77291]
MLDLVLRANGFTRKRGTWTRQNLTSGGLFDLDIVLDNGQYVCTLRKGSTHLLTVTRDEEGVASLVATFLTS